MKNHLTWTFFYSLLFSTACIRVWSRRRRYSQLVEMKKYRQKITHLHCSVGILVLCHLCGTISLAKSIDDNNTWQNIQQRDKIAVKINDLKQKSIAQPNEIRERTNKQPTKSGEKNCEPNDDVNMLWSAAHTYRSTNTHGIRSAAQRISKRSGR